MGYYILDVQALKQWVQGLAVPPEPEIQQTMRVLTNSPVIGYPSFTEDEVRLIGTYREVLSSRLLRVADANAIRIASSKSILAAD